MKRTHRMFLFSIPVILALLFSTLEAMPVSAEDVTPPTDPIVETVEDISSPDTPPVEPTEETAQPETTSTDPTEVPPSEDVAPTEAPTDEAAAAEPTQEEPVAVTEPPLQEEDLDTIPEILAAVPLETELILLDEDGNPQSMVSEEAAETLVQGDPVWCPSGLGAPTPGANGCTPSYDSFADLVTELHTGTYVGTGTIWVSGSPTDSHQIDLDGDYLPTLSDLTIQGGWNGISGVSTIGTASTLAYSMIIHNWLGNIALNNLFVDANDGVGFGLYIETDGNVTINDVKVSNTSGAPIGNNDGADIKSGGFVNISNSTFEENDGTGLDIDSGGSTSLSSVIASNNGTGIYAESVGLLTLTNVTASDNSFVGANLDTYLDGAGSSVIQLTGAANVFTGNDDAGLMINSGASTIINNTNASENSLNGAFIVSGSAVGDTVQINNSTFNLNVNGTGLEIYQFGDTNITFNNVYANGNGTGASIMTYGETGGTIINTGSFNSNFHTGLEIAGNGVVVLSNVSASGNVANGAYLISSGSDVIVVNGTFNNNVQYNSIADPGLYAKAGSNIVLDHVEASENQFGAGAVLESTDAGNISVVNGSIFNSNGTFGLQTTNGNGNITLANMTASFNSIKGAYINGYGPSEVDISTSSFVENGSYGIYVCTDEGDITVSASNFNGYDTGISGPTSIGAKLISQNGGDITVNIGNYINHETAGLILVGTNNIFLNGVFTNNNGKYNLAAYSTYTHKGCYCPGDIPNSVIVNVAGGTFTNAETGIYAKVGTEGDLAFTGTQIFGGNPIDEYVLDTEDIPMCSDCGCDTKEEPEGKPYNIVEVPFTGSDNVPQNCSIYAGTILQMQDGTYVKIGCPFEGYSNLKGLNEGDLPGLLGAGNTFDLGILLGLYGEDGNYIVNSDGSITLFFQIPQNTRGRVHRLLFWDPTIKDGAGGWYELPKFEFGTSFPLHPDDPNDPRLIVNGVSQNGNTMSITVNFGGTFVVVSN